MQALELVRAGAGSGKTTDLCQTVADAVSAGLDPARILATTFTRKAAAELKGRIQIQLLALTNGDAATQRSADRLELAAIGTVHSVAHQLLSRYAIEMGLSPHLEVITEPASERALKDRLGNVSDLTWQPFVDCAGRLGITDIHRRVLTLLGAKRGNLISDGDFTDHMMFSAARVCELLAPMGFSNVATPVSELYDLAERALTNIDALVNDTQKNTNTARQKLRQLRSRQVPLWSSYLLAGKIEAGKRSGADGMLDALRIQASQVRRNPNLQSDILEFSSHLAAATIQLESQYTHYKTERGLVDFTDLEILFLKLLQDDALAGSLAEDFDLVLVDEFQDTNPLQLAIYQKLRQFSPRSRWVGDPKQAIYGFRDTDPELVDEIWNNAAGATRTVLPNNHRSQRGLVQLVGALFAPVFGDDAQQQPVQPSASRGVERWVFDARNQEEDATALACGVAKLRDEGIRFGDIVILERTNRLLQPIASAFDELGIPYLLESPGLLRTREAALVRAGLRIVADRRDSLAAATILHLLSDSQQQTPEWILQRLQSVQNRQDYDDAEPSPDVSAPWSGDPRLSRMESIDRSVLFPTAIVQQVIESLDLSTLVQRWSDPARRFSNLDSVLRHAREYEENALDSGQAATLTGFILCLEQLEEDAMDFRYPPQGHDAVSLMTYHSAKGLEWPVVVLSGLNSNRTANMWSPVVTGGGQSGESPLHGRTLRMWTWPFGESDGPFGGLLKGSGLEYDALASSEGQARTVREALENLRLLYVGCTRARQKLVFAHRENKYDWLAKLPTVDSLLSCNLDEGEHDLDGIDTSFVLRRLNTAMADKCRFEERSQERWISLPGEQNSGKFSPRFHSPSQAPDGSVDAKIDTEDLPGPSHFPSGAKEDQYTAIGDAVHSYFAALPSLRGSSENTKMLVAERCLAAFSVTGMLDPSVLVSSGDRFRDWVEDRYPGAQWHVEVPTIGRRAAGGTWNGNIDLLLQLPGGQVVVIDHKSAPIQRQHCVAKASQFAGQLAAYREVLTAGGETVATVWIHFPLAGVMAELSDASIYGTKLGGTQQ